MVIRRRLMALSGPVEHAGVRRVVEAAMRPPPPVGVAVAMAAPGAGGGGPSGLPRVRGEPRPGGGRLGRRPLLPRAGDACQAHAGHGHHGGRVEAGEHHALRLQDGFEFNHKYDKNTHPINCHKTVDTRWSS